TWMQPTKDYLKWDGTKFKDGKGEVLRKQKKKQNPVPEIRDRVSRKSTPPLSRKSTPVRAATVPEIHPIQEGGPVPDIHPILRFYHSLRPEVRSSFSPELFYATLACASYALDLDVPQNRAKIAHGVEREADVSPWDGESAWGTA